MQCELWVVDCSAQHNAPSCVGLCVDRCRDLFLRSPLVLKTEKTLRPRTRTSAALLPPSINLSCPTKCAPCSPMASKHFENPCFSMSCANNIHLRRGFVVEFQFDFPLCDFFNPTLLLSPQGSLQFAALCSAHALLFIPGIYGQRSGDEHRTPLVLFVLCLAVLSMFPCFAFRCAISLRSMENHSEKTIVYGIHPPPLPGARSYGRACPDGLNVMRHMV